jgi:hypothetical protein
MIKWIPVQHALEDSVLAKISQPKEQLFNLIASTRFGRIENLRISDGEPIFNPELRISRHFKPGNHGPTTSQITRQHYKLIDIIDWIGSGQIQQIEIKDGVPLTVQFREDLSTIIPAAV